MKVFSCDDTVLSSITVSHCVFLLLLSICLIFCSLFFFFCLHRWCVRWCPLSARLKGPVGESVAVGGAPAPRCSQTQRVTLSLSWCPCWRSVIDFLKHWGRLRKIWVWHRANCMKWATKEIRCRDNSTLPYHRWEDELLSPVNDVENLCLGEVTGFGIYFFLITPDVYFFRTQWNLMQIVPKLYVPRENNIFLLWLSLTLKSWCLVCPFTNAGK